MSRLLLSPFLGGLALFLGLAAPLHADEVPAGEPYYAPPPPGFPPVMGGVVLTEKGQDTPYMTYDFSIGAFDASAFFLKMETGEPTFTLTAWPDSNPDATEGILRVKGQFTGKIEPGSRDDKAVVAITIRDDFQGRRWTSEGGEGVLVIDSFKPEMPESSSGYGHATGHFEARICSADGDPAVVAPNARCRQVTGSFETDVQYEP